MGMLVGASQREPAMDLTRSALVEAEMKYSHVIRSSFFWLRVLVLFGASLAFGPGAVGSAAAQPVVGLNSHGLEVPHLTALADLGVRHVRWTIYEHLWTGDRAYREWNTVRLQDAISRGFQVLVIVQGHNTAELARLFPRVEAWQPLNEIDGPGNRERGREYGRHLLAIRERAPRARLVAAGIAPESAAEFWAGMRDVGAVPDAYAVHIYGTPLADHVGRTRAAVLRAAAGVPVWSTEFGLDLQFTDEAGQRGQWQGFIAASAGVYDRVYGYALFTDEDGRHGRVEKHGILRADGTPRATYRWLKNHLRGR
jgi:hypothetical protein